MLFAQLDVGVLDDLRPFGDVGVDDSSEFVWRVDRDLQAKLGQAFTHVGLSGDLHDLLMHLGDDRGCRVGRRQKPEPGDGFEAGVGNTRVAANAS